MELKWNLLPELACLTNPALTLAWGPNVAFKWFNFAHCLKLFYTGCSGDSVYKKKKNRLQSKLL
jgi:hypothetical protein